MSRPHTLLARSAALVGLFLGLAVGAPRDVKAVDLETFAYGRWNGAASTDGSGSFARCSVNARFKRASPSSGRDVGAAITMDRSNGWTFGFAGAGGSSSGSGEPVRLVVDGEKLVETVPDATADDVTLLALPDPASVFAALRKGATLTVETRDDAYDLTLAGLPRALDWVEACARRYETFVPAGREKAAAEAADLRRDIAELMHRLFETVAAKDVRVGPPPGVPAFASEDKTVPWRAEGLQGEGQVWAGKNARQLADKIISTSRGCKRRPATAKGAKPAKADPVVFAVVDCEDPVGARRIALVLMPRGKGGIYLISVHTREGGPDDVARLGERLAEAARKTTQLR